MRQVFPVLVLCVVVVAPLMAQVKPKDVPLSKVGTDYRLIGKLNEPLGTVLTVQGVVVRSNTKLYENKLLLLVQRIDGRATQVNTTIEILPAVWTDIDTELPKLNYGMSVELRGYETGQFYGVPRKALDETGARPALPEFFFRHAFVYHTAKVTDPIRWSPAEFVDREALIEGLAVSSGGKAYIDGSRWRLLVDPDNAWPKAIDGKTVEGRGTIRKADIAGIFRLEKGTTRLVHLRDQVGLPVTLRGTAWSNNHWWFNYRGTDLHVEGMNELPGLNGDFHAEPVLITGILEEAILPEPSQALNTKAKKAKYFIVRKPTWKPIDALLSPERGSP